MFEANKSEKYIRSEVQELIERGNISYSEFISLGCNSWESEAIYPKLTNEALVNLLEDHIIPNLNYSDWNPLKPASSYDKALKFVLVPLLITRLREGKCK